MSDTPVKQQNTAAFYGQAVASFAVAYADRTEADHAALTAAVRSGRIASEPGV